MKKCGIYARVSTTDQAVVKDGSLDTQLELLEDFVKLKGRTGTEPWKVVARYREEGQTGANTNRPQYQQMLADIAVGKVDTLVCTKIDRMTRSLEDFSALQDLLEKHEAKFVSLSESLDTSTAVGRAVMKIILVFAEMEREQTSERTKQTLEARAKKGYSNGGQVLGYDVDEDNPGVPTINETEKQLVLLIFETFLKVQSYRQTAVILNQKGYRTKSFVSRRGKVHSGKPFATMAVKRIVTSPFYVGKITYKGEIMEGRHQPTVTMDMWERVQAIAAGKQGTSKRAETLHVFELKGLVRCGECGSFMTPYYGYGKLHKAYFYYTCTNRARRGPDACSMANVPAPALEKVIAERLIELGKQDRTIDRLVKEAMADMSELLGNLTARREERTVQHRRVQDQIDALVESLAARSTGIKSVGKRLVKLEEQAEQLDDEIMALDMDIDTAKEKAISARSMTQSLTTFGDLYYEATPDERRELVRLRLNRVVWTPGKIRLALFDGPAGSVAGVQPDVTLGSPDVGFIEHWGRLGQVPYLSRT